MDTVADFIADCVNREADPKKREKRAKVYDAYVAWAFASGGDPVGRRRFKAAFLSHGFAEVKDSDWAYANCQLHDVPHLL
jgi:phage/plasmid-associated DNA primase